MVRINETVVVEGKYDKIKLSSLIDAVIIETNGFSIFKDKEKLELLRKLADKNGLLIITDSDGAGFKIRHYLMGAIPKEKIKHAYIPDIFGKEKRKEAPSKEGKLGVEGIPKKELMQALKRAGVIANEVETKAISKRKITKSDFFEDGLSGGMNSNEMRKQLLEKMNLPCRLSSNSLIAVINSIMSYEEYKALVKEISQEKVI